MFNFLKPQKNLILAGCSLLLAFGITSCSKYDLDETDPEGWGASIYSYFTEQGNYTNTVRMINDLGLAEVLAKTGSKTVFAADDEAFERFYASNEWGVKRYEDLSESQKCLLLKGSVINNSYQINDLSSIEGPAGGNPIEGQCMRRLTSQDPGDTLALVNVDDLPNMDEKDWENNSKWKKLRDENLDKIYLLKDATLPPMLHFIEDYLTNNKITNDDYNFLFNNMTNRVSGDASVNGDNIIEHNIKCSNGFIHKVKEVMMPLKSMADIIESKPQVSMWNKLVQRFAFPHRITNEDAIRAYQNRPDRDFSKYRLYERRFFSKKSQGGNTLDKDDDNKGPDGNGLLNFDPGWNTYYSGIVYSGSSEEVTMQKNMGVMMVPSNEALNNYLTKEEGRVLLEEYGSLDKVPNKVIVELINNNMLSSFSESVPSKFSGILNDANDPMGVERTAIDSVWLGCNGAVYLTNKVYSPTSFVSVLYPAVVKNNFNVIRWAVEKNQYNVYLNSLNSRYSFFIPSNDALQCYIDPVSYGKISPVTDKGRQLCRFYFDEENNTVRALLYDCDANGVVDPAGKVVEINEENGYSNMDNPIVTRLREILDNHIVIGDVEDGREYYRTKGGQEIRVENALAGADGMKVYGSRQIDMNDPVNVSYVYDQTKTGNGKAYILEKPIMTTEKNVFDILGEVPEMSKFKDLLEHSGLLENNRYEGAPNTTDAEEIKNQTHDYVRNNGFNSFNSYHYTIYVPTNSSLAGFPTWDDITPKKDTDYEEFVKDSIKIVKWLQLHIQDGSLFVDTKDEAEEGYETAKLDANNKFVKVYAKIENKKLYVSDTPSSSTPREVITTDERFYNRMAREYIVKDYDRTEAKNLYRTSTAVVHLIDKPIKPLE